MYCDVKNILFYLLVIFIVFFYFVSSVNFKLIDDLFLKYIFFIDVRRNLFYLFFKYLSIYYKS